ncbi:cyclophilin-like protein [Suhomyces tanzawaensis NRRL Y-17324]|uniref:Peptidyl-prolyl cis-trans isomerase n=1 Tax=Suhomyces tanzawaensis NRRL Y-17324 TaxID=984487 RepID=A0A1E4SQ52_9ASCO|nr:cyclophilin-like protein [Suhomyces tanzawaensis NRRL Y-17324]ODV81628.1 cyclophilin-like protein [Suhomyces tanzawaensis NRRL Y-17324]
MSILLETTEGNIVIDLDYKNHPTLSWNFLRLCQLNHYFFSPFYGLHKDHLVSCGLPNYPLETENYAACHYVCPEPGISKEDNIEVIVPVVEDDHLTHDMGKVSFVASKHLDKTVVGSEFTISLTSKILDIDTSHHIPFAVVVEGFDTLQTINIAAVDTSGRFVNDIRITHVHTIHDPFRKTIGLDQAIRVAVPTALQIENSRFSRSETAGEDSSTVQALSLELIGDLHHYKAKPSPTTLFVARLNPITTEDSLSVIFGRFGQVVRSTIIKNFAFVELESEKQVEEAYNALHGGCVIDGYEVVVDFSQSVRGRR